MRRWMEIVPVLAAAGIGICAEAAPVEQRFEAESVLTNPEVLLRNKQQKNSWNLWSTDVDAAKKWSGGVVLQGNVIAKDAAPGTTVPVLKFRIPVAQAGRYDLKAQIIRTVGLSLDGGKTWTKRIGPGTIISNRALKAGEVIEFQISGDVLDPSNPGAPYVDFFTLMPAAAAKAAMDTEVRNGGFENSPAGKTPADWSLWTREKGGATATVTTDAHSGKQGARIVSTGKQDWAFNNNAAFPVKAGDMFELTAWVKNNGKNRPNAQLQVVSYKDGKVVNFAMAATPLLKADGQWREFKLNFTIPTGVDKISVRAIGEGIGDLSLDDVSLKSNGNRSDSPEKVALSGADFEVDSVGQQPKKWTLWARDGVKFSAEVTDAAGQGKRAARLRSSGEKDWAFTLRGSVPVTPGQAVRVTCRARRTGANSSTAVVQIMGFQNNKLADFGFADLPLKGLSDQWKVFSMVATVPGSRDGVGIRVIGSGNCDLAVDDFQLEKLPSPPPAPKREPRPVKGFAEKRVVEKLDRGLVALPSEGGIYLSWRLLSTDDPKIGFDIFSVTDGKEQKLNTTPVIQTTDFFVKKPMKNATYLVRPAAGFSGATGSARPVAGEIVRNPYVAYKLSDPKARVNKVGIGDLDGDGKYDYVVRYGNANVDPWYLYWKPSKHPFVLEAIKSDGTILWTKNLGWNIESGIWYSPYIVYDVNGDGRAEVILKAFDPNAGDLREKEGPDKGKVMTGEEYVMVLDGMTGREIARAPWPSRKPFEGANMAYNFYSRNQLAVAYLDGKTPCIIALRGTYGLMLAEAWQLKDGKLEPLWKYNSTGYGREYQGQGAHTTRTVDLDGDGRDEVVLGGAVLDDDGQPLWTTGNGHPDYIYVTNITNRNPGLEIATIYETACRVKGGFTCADAKTGKVIWELDKPSNHIHYGYAGDIDPRYRGWEVGGSDTAGGEQKTSAISRHYSPDGELLRSGDDAPYKGTEHFLYWDADLQREHVSPVVSDFNGGPSGGGYEGSFLMQADVLGDWREEALTVTNGELRIYSTTIPAMDRRVCLMQDPNYRQTIAANAMGYIYDPALSYLPTDLAPNLNLTFRDKVTAGDLEVVVCAPLKEPVKGQLKLFANGGIRLEPKEWAVDLKPGELKIFQVKVKKPADAIAPIRAELTQENGTVLRGQVPTGFKLPPQPKVEGIITEAEDFVNQTGGKVVIRTDKIGMHKKCFSHWDKKGHELSWNLNVPKDGKYQLLLRYAATDDAGREVTLNGESLGVFELPSSGGFGDSSTDWLSYTLERNNGKLVFPLKAGQAKLKIRNADGTSLNLDYIQLIPAN